jgi:hypothetical protein
MSFFVCHGRPPSARFSFDAEDLVFQPFTELFDNIELDIAQVYQETASVLSTSSFPSHLFTYLLTLLSRLVRCFATENRSTIANNLALGAARTGISVRLGRHKGEVTHYG